MHLYPLLRNGRILSRAKMFFRATVLFSIISVSPLIGAHQAQAAVNPKALTDCLVAKHFVMHGEKECSACAIQKSYFGSWFSRVPYVECDINRALCDQKNIHAYPTWEDASGKQYKGAIPLATLEQLAGCQSPVTKISTVPQRQETNIPKTIPVKEPAQEYPVAPPARPSILTRTAIISALLAGFFSFFAPCLLPLFPAYFSVITGFTFAELYGLTQEHIRRRIFISSLVFATGFSLIFILIGATGSVIGQFLSTYLPRFVQISGGILIILGFMQMGVIASSSAFFDYAWNIQRRMTRLGLFTAFITGIAAALSWIPCVGPLLSSILLLTAKSTSIGEGTLLLLLYSLGLTIPFILAGIYFPTVLEAYQAHRKAFHLLSRLAGIFLIAYGILLLTGHYQQLLDTINQLQVKAKHMITISNMLE